MADEQLHLQRLLTAPEGRSEGPPWDPTSVKVALNVRMDAAFVPSGAGARVSYCHVVVLDEFFTEQQRATLLGAISGPDAVAGAPHRAPPEEKWERKTADGAGLPPTWGVKPQVMARIEGAVGALAGALEGAPGGGPEDGLDVGLAMRQVQGRLCALYPEYDIFHMPSEAMQLGMRQRLDSGADSENSGEVLQQESAGKEGVVQEGLEFEDEEHAKMCSNGMATEPAQKRAKAADGSNMHGKQGAAPPGATMPVDCGRYVANAAVVGDQFQWHIDADPSALFPGPWVDAFGLYYNGEAGRPLLVTMLLYLDKEWPRNFDAETLFLDSGTDTGVLVRPKAYRAVLMDQDCMHRLSVPSVAAARPRYSLVWKLVFVRKGPRGGMSALEPCICRPEWGPPVDFGSAARVAALRRAVECRDGLPS